MTLEAGHSTCHEERDSVACAVHGAFRFPGSCCRSCFNRALAAMGVPGGSMALGLFIALARMAPLAMGQPGSPTGILESP
jgi:hypothetical protein